MSSSRPYKVTVKESVSRVVVAEDHVETKVNVLPILPSSETGEIAKRILREHGFNEDDDGAMIREGNGVRTEIDPETGDVSVSSHGSENVELEDEEDAGGGCPCSVRSADKVREGLRIKLDNIVDEKEKDLQRQVTGKLEGALRKLGCELEHIANQITSSAIKRRASQMGTIKRIEQDGKTGSMTIVVEV